MLGHRRARNPFLITPEDLLEESAGPLSGEGPKGLEVQVPTEADLKFGAELVALLEDELNIDMRRVRLRARGGHVYVQGTVESSLIKKQAEKILRERPNVKDVESSLTVQSHGE